VNVESLIARVRTLGASLTWTQRATLVGVFVAVVGLVVASAYWVNTPTYAVLFSDMDAESAGGVVERLKTDKVPYTVDDGGRTIRVPAAKVDELRLDFASQGMPNSGRIGFEIFDRTAFGVTDFLEHVNYRRALEGELARTIGTIAEVASARVHIAMPRPSLFAGQDQAAKASVVLKLRNSRPLPASTIAAISSLVAASVEGLGPDAVVLLDTFGRSLSQPQGDSVDGGGGLRLERQQRIEHELSARVVSLLEPIVGADHVRVNVSARLVGDSQEETEEKWDPTPILRSRQSVTQVSQVAGAAQGVAGARANVPVAVDPSAKPGAAPLQAAAVPASAIPTHVSETTNYEVSRLTRHRIQPPGQVGRLSVAVLLADERVTGEPDRTSKPRTPEEIQKIRDVVAAAVGLDTERGDQLTVTDIPFEEPPADEPVSLPTWRRYSPVIIDGGRVVAVFLVAALVVFGVMRPVVQRTLGAVSLPGAAAARQLPRTVDDIEGDIEGELDAGEAPSEKQRRLPVLTRRVAKLTQQEPENAARLVRSWLTEEER
jgi:flagellar M-ring protein FliF